MRRRATEGEAVPRIVTFGGDSAYLCENLSLVLKAGLVEVCRTRPTDPIEYLANWLLNFRKTH